MSRTILLSLFLSLAACGGAGRCVNSSGCPAGAACDANLGVCVVGGNLTAGAADAGSPAPVARGYAHACQVTANCADLPGTTCEYGMCLNSCEGSASCAGGTACVVNLDKRFCGLSCITNADCTGTCVSASGQDGGGTRVCWNSAPRPAAPIGGNCSNDGDCAGSALCLITQARPPFCGMSCTSPSVSCGSGAVCVSVGASTSASCYAQCPTPGTQSTCRAGFRCIALTDKTYGACL